MVVKEAEAVNGEETGALKGSELLLVRTALQRNSRRGSGVSGRAQTISDAHVVGSYAKAMDGTVIANGAEGRGHILAAEIE
jgi:hypothetical protein